MNHTCNHEGYNLKPGTLFRPLSLSAKCTTAFYCWQYVALDISCGKRSGRTTFVICGLQLWFIVDIKVLWPPWYFGLQWFFVIKQIQFKPEKNDQQSYTCPICPSQHISSLKMDKCSIRSRHFPEVGKYFAKRAWFGNETVETSMSAC